MKNPRRGVVLRPVRWLLVLAAVGLVLSGLPAEAQAQSVVVGRFSGKPAKVARKVAGRLAKALKKRGARIVPTKRYLKAAKRFKKFRKGKRAYLPAAMKKVAPKLKLDALITGRLKKGKIFITAIGKNGKVLLKKKIPSRKKTLNARINEAADEILAQLGAAPLAAVPAEPPPEEPPAEEPAAEQPAEDPMLPPWAKSEEGKPAEAGPPAEEPPAEEDEEAEDWAKKEEPAEKKKKDKDVGAIPNILAAVGAGMNMRGGLSPRHESGIYPGLRADLRLFLGAFIDKDWIEGIGVGGGFDMGLGLKYGREGGGGDWDSTQYAWNAELMYRLAFLNDVILKPAFLVRLGFGNTASTIDTDDAAARSAGYMYPYARLEIALMLWDPYLRLNLGGGYLFVVMADVEDVDTKTSSNGSGFVVGGGIDVVLLEMIDIGIGYEMRQLLGFKGPSPSPAGGTEEMSDVYQSFYLRVGWAFH